MKGFAGRLLLVAAVVVALTVGISGTATAGSDKRTVRYQVTGNFPVADYISYQTDTGQWHEANVKLPWSTEFFDFGTAVFVISAQGPGSITCTISINGNVVSNTTATGQPARAACEH
ncbi:MmpS family transport accessory protein [Mycobacterium shimoidei]|uniref:Uncharacterized protein n=1 Tax=Mycobacterium shimoidei TaxID=29313 RepID=A0A1E3TFF7_MYCSH|nr:MmpS family transport accessory protein [Mycobacterium shimoidei]MCV7261265.1 hypothetical protein [Mycobacterium shimoidei]ODR13147.1 hypothetical protein BHQ16_11725 [Mycobacterium shimoidei]ORW78504.1 hypothetical protein AWC26_17570 [Mycobacterium shimoidei]SRX94778.1 hypothetical protein MSP7336_03039 [Mycobacterium shimoidei]